MNFLRFLATSVMTLSVVGCSMCGNYAVDPCDACSNGPVIGGGILRFFALPTSSCSCGSGCGSGYYSDYGYGGMPASSSCGCGSCGCGAKPWRSCGGGFFSKFRGRANCACQPYDSCGGSCGSPSGCGCGQSAGAPGAYTNPSSTYYPSMSPGSPTPKPLQEIPATQAPAPPAQTQQSLDPEPSAMNRAPANMPSRMVSYEEFQRLPGTIISGPGATSPATTNSTNQIQAARPATTTTTTQQVAPVASWQSANMPQPSAPAQNQQAVWSPSKTY